MAWPIVTRISSAPRWLFFRLAILVTLVLWLPDLYILHQGQPAKAVAVLMVMHLAIAVVTYNLLVRVAVRQRPGLTAVRAPGQAAARAAGPAASHAPRPEQAALGGPARRCAVRGGLIRICVYQSSLRGTRRWPNWPASTRPRWMRPR